MREKITEPWGTIVYLKDGVPHREDGPAIIDPDGGKTWMWEGLRHRDDGPAIEEPDGTREFWIHGKFIRAELPYPWSKWLEDSKKEKE